MRVANALTRPLVDVVAIGEQCARPEKSAKTLPPNIERRVFADARSSAYRPAV